MKSKTWPLLSLFFSVITNLLLSAMMMLVYVLMHDFSGDINKRFKCNLLVSSSSNCNALQENWLFVFS